MSDLVFKVVLVSDRQLDERRKRQFKHDVEQCIKDCDVQVSYINFFQATKTDEEFHPEIEELILQVEAACSSSYPRTPRLRYAEFFRRFNEKCRRLPCWYIMLYSDESFTSVRQPRSEINCKILQFGTLPHDGYFHEYTTLEGISKATFYHDTRNVVIEREKNDFEFSFTYDNIRNIFVNIQGRPSQIFFDLFNPPIIHRLESCVVNGYSTIIRHRNLDMNGLIDFNILGRANVLCLPIYNHNLELDTITANIRARCSSKPVYYSCFALKEMVKPSANNLLKKYSMEFGCMYMMTAIIQRNFVLLAQLSSDSDYPRVVKFSKKNPKALESALADVLTTLESGKILNYWKVIENRFHYYVAVRNMVDFKEYIVPPNCCLTRRITVTPTRLLFWAPELLFGNRVVRNFDPEFAIRVSFKDDNMRKLTSPSLNADAGFMETCVSIPMSKGIQIDTREYEFLAWSNSQLRDHGIWMYAKDMNGVTSADIRRWMGDFSQIHNVPKYMARMGQCFSQTVDTISVPLEPQSVRTVPDIERGYDPENGKPYNFSDGIGRICTELAEEVHQALGHDKLCSAFQIRYGGYKGMLVVDPNLKDTKIEFRESMKKFDCPNSTRLEIARTSAPVSLQLNRPLIALLNDLGVRHRVFLRLQENMLKTITDMLFEEEKAAEILKVKTQAMYNFEELSQAGIHLTTEPFFRSILLAVHRYQIGLLKAKANVSIDPDYGRNMLGVLDETGILNYDEIFVQYSTDISCGETTRETKILEGVVLVTKSPCHHPGDVRKFLAVDVPELHHIVDCIVFPQNGPRPHPNEMAGADLDGDEFAVIWLPELIFQCGNKPAAHFPSMKSQDKFEITLEDMINCLEDYIRKDQIGMISSAHLALADRFGIDDDVCKAVARKVSIAVDFAKTGQVVPLIKSEKPRQYPDFMENTSREEYKSVKALGKMYRICRDYETENEETCSMCQKIKVDPYLVYPGWEEYKHEAISMRNKYNAILGSLLRNYGIEHEAEVVSTAFTQLHCRYQERNDRMDVMKVVVACFKKLLNDFMLEFSEEFTQYSNADEMDEAILQKASAWYMVTYSDSEPKYLSFPWIVGKYLAVIKIRQSKTNSEPFSPAIMKFDERILECENEEQLPKYEETGIWHEYKCLCDSKIIKRALQVLILWGNKEEIIDTSERQRGLLYVETFVKVFFHVAEICKYVTRTEEDIVNESKAYSSGKLCLEFLKFCSSLRFYNQKDIHEILPFYVYKPTKLAKRAVVAYHKFALLGLFRNLYFDQKIDDDLIDMNPISIDFKVFGGNPIPKTVLKKAENALQKYSDVEYICLSDHRQTKKVWISAIGSELSIRNLRSILRKSPRFLKELFKTGNMPQEDISVVDIVGASIGRNGMSQNNRTAVGAVHINIGKNSVSEKNIPVVDVTDTTNDKDVIMQKKDASVIDRTSAKISRNDISRKDIPVVDAVPINIGKNSVSQKNVSVVDITDTTDDKDVINQQDYVPLIDRIGANISRNGILQKDIPVVDASCTNTNKNDMPQKNIAVVDVTDTTSDKDDIKSQECISIIDLTDTNNDINIAPQDDITIVDVIHGNIGENNTKLKEEISVVYNRGRKRKNVTNMDQKFKKYIRH